MAKEKRLVEEEKVGMFEFNEIAKDAIESRKSEFVNLQHNILLAKSELQAVRDTIMRERTVFDNWKKGEEERLKKTIVERENLVIDKERRVDIAIQNIDKRIVELRERENAISLLLEEKAKLGEARIEVERLRARAQDELTTASRQVSESKNQMNLANIRLEEANKKEARADLINAELARREDSIANKQKESLATIRNIEEAKMAIVPKIKELEQLKESIELSKKEIEEKLKEINRKILQDESMVIAFSDKQKKLESKEKELNGREQEVNRKLLLLKVDNK